MSVLPPRMEMHDLHREILKNDPRQADDLSTVESPLGWSAYGAQTDSALIFFVSSRFLGYPLSILASETRCWDTPCRPSM